MAVMRWSLVRFDSKWNFGFNIDFHFALIQRCPTLLLFATCGDRIFTRGNRELFKNWCLMINARYFFTFMTKVAKAKTNVTTEIIWFDTAALIVWWNKLLWNQSCFNWMVKSTLLESEFWKKVKRFLFWLILIFLFFSSQLNLWHGTTFVKTKSLVKKTFKKMFQKLDSSSGREGTKIGIRKDFHNKFNR